MPRTTVAGRPATAAARVARDTCTTGASRGAVRWRADRSAGGSPSSSAAATAAAPPASATGQSKSRPGVGVASRASPTGVNGDSRVASPIPAATPATAIASVRSMLRAVNCPDRTPSAASTGPSAASATAWRASACPVTSRKVTAVRAATTHQATAWGWMAALMAVAASSRSSTFPP